MVVRFRPFPTSEKVITIEANGQRTNPVMIAIVYRDDFIIPVATWKFVRVVSSKQFDAIASTTGGPKKGKKNR